LDLDFDFFVLFFEAFFFAAFAIYLTFKSMHTTKVIYKKCA
jgi:hypothetical protein